MIHPDIIPAWLVWAISAIVSVAYGLWVHRQETNSLNGFRRGFLVVVGVALIMLHLHMIGIIESDEILTVFLVCCLLGFPQLLGETVRHTAHKEPMVRGVNDDE